MEYQDAAYQERRGALPWNQDVAAARHRASRQPEGVPAARLDAEPALAAVEPRADSPARPPRPARRALRVRSALRVRLAQRALRVRRVPQLP